MKFRRTLPACASAAALAIGITACGGGGDTFDANSGVVIRNVTVVNTRDGSLAPAMAVVVDAGRIQKVAANMAVRTGGTAQDVDASGKYIVPGYNDMHTHLFNAPAAEMPLVQKLLVANGITGIREMGGSPAHVLQANQLNADRAAGTIDTPEILAVPGRIVGLPSVPGVATTAAPAAAATSAAAAVQEVQDQKAYGAGFIKVIAGARDAILALLGEARRQAMPVAGHFPPSLSAADASEAGWRASEHIGAGLTILLDCSSNEATLRPLLLAGTPMAQLRQPVLDSYDDAKCQSLARTFARNGTWHVPTLIRLRTGLATNDPLYTTDPNLAYVSPATRAQWSAAATTFGQANDAAGTALLARYFDRQQTLPAMLKRNGVKLLAGSDLSINPGFTANYVIPGFSLHQEFALLSAAGLSPLEILQATTLHAAEFLGRQASMGSVEEGRNADLVLLDANPVQSAANLGRIGGVLLRGKYFSHAALDQLKSEVAAAYATQAVTAAQLQQIQAAPAHED